MATSAQETKSEGHAGSCGMAERPEAGCELEAKAWEIPEISHDFPGISRIFMALCAGTGLGVKPKCRAGVDFTACGGGPRRVPSGILGLHSYPARQEVLCAWVAKQAMPRSCGAADGRRATRPMASEVHSKSRRVSEAEWDLETDQQPGVHQVNPGEHQPETQGVMAWRVGHGRN